MSWFGKLIGTDKAIDNLVDKDNGLLVRAGTALGNLHYSEQEKAIATQETREWGIKQLDALHPFKVTQRILAIAATFMWLTCGINVLIMIWLDSPQLDNMLAFALSDYVWWPTALVFGLYFAGGTISSFTGTKKK